jgi:hypothetical protein
MQHTLWTCLWGDKSLCATLQPLFRPLGLLGSLSCGCSRTLLFRAQKVLACVNGLDERMALLSLALTSRLVDAARLGISQ